MRKCLLLGLLALTFVIFIPVVNGVDILGISPGCIQISGQNCTHYPIISGETETFEIHVFNLHSGERTFSVRSERDLENYTTISPETFTLSRRYNRDIPHTGCVSEEGCQIVYVTADTKGVKPGKYETLIIAGTHFSQSGSLALNAEVGSRLLIEVQENTYYKLVRIFKENSVLITILSLALVAGLFFAFKKQITNLIQNKKSDKIYKESKKKHKK